MTASQREAVTQSKDPYLFHRLEFEGFEPQRADPHADLQLIGSFDSIFPFASQWKDSAQDDNLRGGVSEIRQQIHNSAVIAATESCK